MDSFLDDIDFPEDEERSLTYEEVWAIIEEELQLVLDNENPYRPLNFHDPFEGH